MRVGRDKRRKPRTALETLASVQNLSGVWSTFRAKARNSAAGVNGLSPKSFDAESKYRIAVLSSEIKAGYSFSNLRGVAVPKKDPTKFRVICVPTIQDRIVQRSLLKSIEERAGRLGIENDVSFGFVKERDGIKRGTGGARDVALSHRTMKPWAFKADISAFFDRIQRDELAQSFRRAFSLKSLGNLVEGAIHCEVDDSDPRIKRILDENGILKGRGLRQGMPLSPILSNFLLREFDRTFVKEGLDLVRYADDLLVFADSEQACKEIQELTDYELAKLGLSLSPSKTEICAPEQPVEFLGLELGLKTGTNKYVLTVSEKQLAKIREEFVKLHDIDYLCSKKLDAHALAKRLSNMANGYRVAYGVADNYSHFENLIEHWHQNCFTKVYSSIFGRAAIERLTPQQRRFLMI